MREVVVGRVLVPPGGVFGSEVFVAAAVARGRLVAVVAAVVEAVAAKHLGNAPVVVAHEVRQGVAAWGRRRRRKMNIKKKKTEPIDIFKHEGKDKRLCSFKCISILHLQF